MGLKPEVKELVQQQRIQKGFSAPKNRRKFLSSKFPSFCISVQQNASFMLCAPSLLLPSGYRRESSSPSGFQHTMLLSSCLFAQQALFLLSFTPESPHPSRCPVSSIPSRLFPSMPPFFCLWPYKPSSFWVWEQKTPSLFLLSQQGPFLMALGPQSHIPSDVWQFKLLFFTLSA